MVKASRLYAKGLKAEADEERKLAEAMDELELRNHGLESGTFHTEPISKNISHNVP